MLALFFEVRPYPDQVQHYLDTAARLKPELDRVGGCLFIERFKSLSREGMVLSFQLWRDEAAMTAWRTNAIHHAVQMQGRTRIFADYRLRVAEIIEAAEVDKPVWRPAHHGTYNDRAHRAPRYLQFWQSTSATPPAATVESFASLYREGHFLHVGDLATADAGAVHANAVDATHYAYRIAEVERDYGMHERAEAPQFCPVISSEKS